MTAASYLAESDLSCRVLGPFFACFGALAALLRFNMTGTPPRILVADDEPAIRRLLGTILATQGYEVIELADGSSALEAAKAAPSSGVLLLDLTLPDIDGIEIIKLLRASGASLPIIVLSNRDDEGAKVTALDLGADDYLTKPFGAQELFARIRASMRHRLAAGEGRQIFTSGDLTIDFMSRTVTLAGKEIRLSPKEYALLAFLAKNAGKAVTHSQILREVWGDEADAQYIRIYIRFLRQKLREAPETPRYILTEQGIGYRLRDI
jgi:two-component system KDP operon response regulator KdpE